MAHEHEARPASQLKAHARQALALALDSIERARCPWPQRCPFFSVFISSK
jgi:hypothetical protein